MALTCAFRLELEGYIVVARLVLLFELLVKQLFLLLHD